MVNKDSAAQFAEYELEFLNQMVGKVKLYAEELEGPDVSPQALQKWHLDLLEMSEVIEEGILMNQLTVGRLPSIYGEISGSDHTIKSITDSVGRMLAIYRALEKKVNYLLNEVNRRHPANKVPN